MACELYEDLTDAELEASPPSVGHIRHMADEIRAARRFRAALGLEAWPEPEELLSITFAETASRHPTIKIELRERGPYFPP